jgi:hypothetical protein
MAACTPPTLINIAQTVENAARPFSALLRLLTRIFELIIVFPLRTVMVLLIHNTSVVYKQRKDIWGIYYYCDYVADVMDSP